MIYLSSESSLCDEHHVPLTDDELEHLTEQSTSDIEAPIAFYFPIGSHHDWYKRNRDRRRAE